MNEFFSSGLSMKIELINRRFIGTNFIISGGTEIKVQRLLNGIFRLNLMHIKEVFSPRPDHTFSIELFLFSVSRIDFSWVILF